VRFRGPLAELGCYEKSVAIRITRTYRENIQLQSSVQYRAEVSYEKIIAYTIGIDIVDSAGREVSCIGTTVDCETSW
jgi:hypothetical protein